MAAVVAFPTLCSSICRTHSHGISCPSSSTPALSFLRLRNISSANRRPCLTKKKVPEFFQGIRALAEETLIPEEQGQEKEDAPDADQPVSVPVSPSDILTMFFQAEGTMNESAVTTVTKALEDIEGISDLKVQILEGFASVELKKQTTVQATGVASNLVEIIQGSGFKLQTLNLSFEDEEDTIN